MVLGILTLYTLITSFQHRQSKATPVMILTVESSIITEVGLCVSDSMRYTCSLTVFGSSEHIHSSRLKFVILTYRFAMK
ncbi:hypothetical protein EV421DRAFT_362733 [Armillaria borealis]|uniref:Secreted protein n=1 Tax=Armillaria borealis TaxID=47425 RepID=A0AA39MS76_9AGAR|nr:hypothetical protein EV421DRAFT_362733 [Armillaria borealis]